MDFIIDQLDFFPIIGQEVFSFNAYDNNFQIFIW